VSLFVVAAVACSSTTTESGGYCMCITDGVDLVLTPERARTVSGIVLWSDACSPGRTACWDNSGPACTRYHVTATAEGFCKISVAFDDGSLPFVTGALFVHRYAGTCCDGYFTENNTIEVPDSSSSDASSDASKDGD